MASRLLSSLARQSRHCAGLRTFPRSAYPETFACLGGAAAASPRSDRRRYASPACAQPGTKSGQAGFSYPGPKSLDKIVKVQLLNKHGTPRVREIWSEYHKDHKTAVGDSLTKEEFNLFMQRTKRCSVFVLPVPRENGYFTLLLQFQDKYCLCTYLEDYKKDPSAAMPYMTFTVFDDMVEKKSVALIRGEVTNHITVPEARKILDLIKMYYLGPRHLYDNVIAFNENSKNFDFQSVLNVAEVST